MQRADNEREREEEEEEEKDEEKDGERWGLTGVSPHNGGFNESNESTRIINIANVEISGVANLEDFVAELEQRVDTL